MEVIGALLEHPETDIFALNALHFHVFDVLAFRYVPKNRYRISQKSLYRLAQFLFESLRRRIDLSKLTFRSILQLQVALRAGCEYKEGKTLPRLSKSICNLILSFLPRPQHIIWRQNPQLFTIDISDMAPDRVGHIPDREVRSIRSHMRRHGLTGSVSVQNLSAQLQKIHADTLNDYIAQPFFDKCVLQ